MQVRLYDCRKTGRLPLLYTVLKFSGAHRSLPPFPGTANPCYSACGGTNPVKIAWLVPPQDVQRRFLAPRFGKRHKPVKCSLTHAEKRITPTTQYANTRNTRTRCPYFEPKRHETWALQNGNITKIRDNDARTRAEKKLETGTSIKSISHPDYRTTDEHICTKAPGKRSHYAKEQKRQFAVTIFTILFLQNYHYHNAFSISCLSIQKLQS